MPLSRLTCFLKVEILSQQSIIQPLEQSRRKTSDTKHDNFCPGMSLDVKDYAIVTGGDDANKTSIFDPSTNS